MIHILWLTLLILHCILIITSLLIMAKIVPNYLTHFVVKSLLILNYCFSIVVVLGREFNDTLFTFNQLVTSFLIITIFYVTRKEQGFVKNVKLHIIGSSIVYVISVILVIVNFFLTVQK